MRLELALLRHRPPSGGAAGTVGYQWLNTKYGWVKCLGDVVSRLRTRARVVITIDVGPENR